VPLDQLTRALVPQALGRASAQEQQQVRADEVIATQLDPETRSVLTIVTIVLSEINGRLSYACWRSVGGRVGPSAMPRSCTILMLAEDY
jgi:hypothetical protein